ncbi:cell division protein FtsW [Lachnospiraceae bacterium KM106-2]|nr:cell division protein FtsW [Lachnospiraceae bacterium KM106-2]
MGNVITELSKYVICFLMVLYTIYSYTVFRGNNPERKRWIFRKQNMLMFLIHAISYLIIFINSDWKNSMEAIKIPLFYIAQVIVFILTILIYKLFYKGLSRLVLNHMLMLISISFIMLTRIKYDYAIRQFFFVCAGLALCLVVPVLIKKMTWLKDLGWIYGGVGFVMLAIVLVIGKAVYGAKNWIIIGSFRFQPSEFVKILFVFFAASLLAKQKDFKSVVKISALAAAHVLVLVLERDLGGALIYFITYLLMLYVATAKPLYLIAGFGGGSLASIVAYKLFAHVRIRVAMWKNPWSDVTGKGYQVVQSLFAIGTGSWFGMGLTKGMPNSIPVVESDFIFSAISEEFGGIFAICLILICISCFIMFVNISVKMKKEFYKLVALGLSIMYIFQLFLALGGVTKFIPSTGVTIPLVSNGGSSVLSTIILFHIIQGLYVLNQDKDDTIEKEKRRARSVSKRDGEAKRGSRKKVQED